ncbi:MAG: hypothetical protein WC390_08610 [Sulfurimonas sp.]|jgi:hypothetical protein
MAKFRKKPVIIDAWPISEILQKAAKDFHSLPASVIEGYENNLFVLTSEALFVKTLEGEYRGESTDMLLRGVSGEFYPCKPDIFALTYEKVEDE